MLEPKFSGIEAGSGCPDAAKLLVGVMSWLDGEIRSSGFGVEIRCLRLAWCIGINYLDCISKSTSGPWIHSDSTL